MLKNKKKTTKILFVNSKHTILAIKVNWILFHLFPPLNIVSIQNICYKKSFVTFTLEIPVFLAMTALVHLA